MLTLGRPSILHDLLAPSSGRVERTLQITAVTTIVVIIAMTFQIPDPALSTYIIFFVAKEDTGRSILISVVFILAILMVIGLLFLLLPMSLNHPSLRILFIAATSFVMFFLAKASKLAPLAGTLGLILAAGFNAEQNAPVGEIATRALLYVALLTTFPIVLNIVCNVACGRHPERLLRQGLAKRFAVASDALLGGDEKTGARLASIVGEGNAELSTELKMVALFHRLPRDTVARLKALITLSYALVLSAAARRGKATVENADTVVAERLARLAQAIHNLPDAIDASAPGDSDASDFAVSDLSAQLESLTSMMEDVVAGAPLPKIEAELAAKPKSGFFKPDAFTNPDYERFAAKATTAVMVCYLTFNLLDWSGISTCMITCFIVALSTVGESTQKMMLRLTGCVFGAVIGYFALVFVLPLTSQITGLVTLIAVITLPAAWIAVGSPRVSYIGFQIAFAAYLCVLQGTEPKFDLTIARDRFIGILFGNITVFVIFTQVYAASLLPALTSQLVTILERCRDVLKSMSETKADRAACRPGRERRGASPADRTARVVAYGFEKRPTRFGRLHVLSCRLIDRALHEVVSDIARLAAFPTSEGGGAGDVLKTRCAAVDQRLEALADALKMRSSLTFGASVVEGRERSCGVSCCPCRYMPKSPWPSRPTDGSRWRATDASCARRRKAAMLERARPTPKSRATSLVAALLCAAVAAQGGCASSAPGPRASVAEHAIQARGRHHADDDRIGRARLRAGSGRRPAATGPASRSRGRSHVYTLAELIDIAQTTNPETRSSWELARQAALAVGITKALYLPIVTATVVGGYQHFSQSGQVAKPPLDHHRR